VLDFAKEYSKRGSSNSNLSSPSKATTPKLVKRNSILSSAGDADHLNEVREAVAHLNHAFDAETPWTPPGGWHGETHHHSALGKYLITTDGDMFLVNKLPEVQCSASEAIELLWDHRESTMCKIAGDIVAHCDIKGNVNANQRILWLRYCRPGMGVAGNTSARDAAVIADKSAAMGELPIITWSSVATRLIPEHEHYVRGDTKVLGFVVKPLDAHTCSIFFATEFGMGGGFSNPLFKCFLKCSGFDKVAARNCSNDCNHSLTRLKDVLELRHQKKTGKTAAAEAAAVAKSELL